QVRGFVGRVAFAGRLPRNGDGAQPLSPYGAWASASCGGASSSQRYPSLYAPSVASSRPPMKPSTTPLRTTPGIAKGTTPAPTLRRELGVQGRGTNHIWHRNRIEARERVSAARHPAGWRPEPAGMTPLPHLAIVM